MKCTPIKRGNAPLRRKTPLRHAKLRVVGHPEASEVKREIQAILRQIAILRDKGCVLRYFPEAHACGGYNTKGELILQAEHLITRSNSATFADMRNIVCLCKRHHGFFKPQHSRLYWELIERHVGPQRWSWIKLAEADRTPHKMDWKIELLALESELSELKKWQEDIHSLA